MNFREYVEIGNQNMRGTLMRSLNHNPDTPIKIKNQAIMGQAFAMAMNNGLSYAAWLRLLDRLGDPNIKPLRLTACGWVE